MSSALKIILRRRFVWVAFSQLCGLLSFAVVAKFLLSTQDLHALATYQGVQAVTSFLMMSIQYSNSRSQIFGSRFLFFFVFAYGVFFPMFFDKANTLFWNFSLIVVFATACYANLLLTALEKFNFLLILQVATSTLLPFSIISPFEVGVFFVLVLVFLLWNFRRATDCLEDMRFSKDGRNWISSLSVQAPLVLLPMFDQTLIGFIGAEVYRNYALAMKFCAGPINLLFAAAQFRVLERKFFKHQKLFFGCLISAFLTILLTFFQFDLVYQVVALVVFTNFSSLLIRTNNLIEANLWSLLVGLVSISSYFCFLKFSKHFYADAPEFFTLGILFCVAFVAIFSSLNAIRFYKSPKIKK